jgi:hypothetical protein
MTRVIRVVALGLLALAPAARAAEPADLLARQERQRQIQAETEHMVRRVGAMLRVMEYYQLDKSAERQMLQEVATALGGLSREQMTAVIAQLDAAARNPDAAKSQKEVEAAYGRHREIMASLKGLLSAYDAVKTLDQAAERLDRAARDQVELSLQTLALGNDLQNGRGAIDRYGDRGGRFGRGMRGVENPFFRAQRLSDDQEDFRKEVMALWKQAGELRAQLPAEQRPRLDRAAAIVKEVKPFDAMSGAFYRLREPSFTDDQQKSWERSFAKQWDSAGHLLELAYALREPRERLTAMRDARERLGRVLGQEEALLRETRGLADAKPDDDQAERERQEQEQFGGRRFNNMRIGEDDTPTARARELADRQGRAQHATRDGRLLLKPHAAELAEKITEVEESMREVQVPLRDRKAADAADQQDQAVIGLRTVIAELDRLILQAEQEKHDSLAALQKALEKLDQIIRDQKETRQTTEDADEARDNDRLAKQAQPQSDLTRRTDELRQSPLPYNAQAQTALGQAVGSMASAAQELRRQQGQPALKDQDEALKALELARQQMAEQAAAIEKRREEMATLEDAAKKVAELARQEKQVADQAKALPDSAKRSDAQPSADKQAGITPPTREVAGQVKDAAPAAAQHLDRAAEKMDAAQSALDKPQPKPAAKAADEATKKLLDAHKELMKELEKRLGSELADQTALQPNRVNPEQAAREIAKALELSKQAAAESQKATPQEGMQADLAKLQRQVADRAEQMKLDKAAPPAGQAADDLKQGDLGTAMQQQQKALEQMQAAAQGAKDGPKDGPKAGQQSGPPNRMPSPASAQNAGQLAQAQEALMETTRALAKSQAATQAAQSAVAQAQATAPRGVQPQLGQASQQLGQASQALGQAQPGNAGAAQGQASQSLSQALAALQAAQAAAQANGQGQQGQGQGQGQQGQGQEPGQGEGQGQGQGQGQQGQGQGQQPGQGQGRNNQPGQSMENNQTRGSGNRLPDGRLKNAPSQSNDMNGEGAFLHLPPRQRELIRQAISDKLPPEYAALIQQYYVNIARGKPAAKPTTPEPAKPELQKDK